MEQQLLDALNTIISELKQLNTQRHITYVPYQMCPQCHGEGVTHDELLPSITQTCDVCWGKMVIPMFVLPVEEEER